jgi:predicted nucleic acid-binding protein
MVVFDTSILVDASRRNTEALKLIVSYSEKERIAITIISKYEILRGAYERDSSFVAELLKQFVIYEFGDSATAEVVKAYKTLSEKGKKIIELDVLIAGLVAANNETLVTRDRDFLNFESTKINCPWLVFPDILRLFWQWCL